MVSVDMGLDVGGWVGGWVGSEAGRVGGGRKGRREGQGSRQAGRDGGRGREGREGLFLWLIPSPAAPAADVGRSLCVLLLPAGFPAVSAAATAVVAGGRGLLQFLLLEVTVVPAACAAAAAAGLNERHPVTGRTTLYEAVMLNDRAIVNAISASCRACFCG